MELEENRLASFFNRQDGLTWPHTKESHPYCTPKILSLAGFFYSPTSTVSDMCQCYCCGIRLRDWEMLDNPWQEHKKHKPDCPILLENSNEQEIGFGLFGDEELPSNPTITNPNPIYQNDTIISDEMKLRGQFVSDLLFSLVNPQNDWNFNSEQEIDTPSKPFNIPQIKETNA